MERLFVRYSPSVEWPRATLRPQQGFGLLGLLVFIAILGLASSSVLVLGQVMQRRWAEEQLLYVGDQYRRALRQYAEATPVGQPRYPASLDALLKDPRYPGVRRYLRQRYSDPITGRDDWVLIMAPEGGIMGLHSASPRLPIKQGNFGAHDEAFAGRQSYREWEFTAYVAGRAPATR